VGSEEELKGDLAFDGVYNSRITNPSRPQENAAIRRDRGAPDRKLRRKCSKTLVTKTQDAFHIAANFTSVHPGEGGTPQGNKREGEKKN